MKHLHVALCLHDLYHKTKSNFSNYKPHSSTSDQPSTSVCGNVASTKTDDIRSVKYDNDQNFENHDSTNGIVVKKEDDGDYNINSVKHENKPKFENDYFIGRTVKVEDDTDYNINKDKYEEIDQRLENYDCSYGIVKIGDTDYDIKNKYKNDQRFENYDRIVKIEHNADGIVKTENDSDDNANNDSVQHIFETSLDPDQHVNFSKCAYTCPFCLKVYFEEEMDGHLQECLDVIDD